jgi:hypothetical protein
VRTASIIRDDHQRWRQYAPLKRRSTIILHGSISQKTTLNIKTLRIRQNFVIFLKKSTVQYISITELKLSCCVLCVSSSIRTLCVFKEIWDKQHAFQKYLKPQKCTGQMSSSRHGVLLVNKTKQSSIFKDLLPCNTPVSGVGTLTVALVSLTSQKLARSPWKWLPASN